MMSSHGANVVMISTSCERSLNAQEEMLALSGTQRHVGGPLCTNKLQKIACAVVCPSQIARQLASATYSMLLLLYSFMKEVTPSAKAGINGEP